MVPCMLGDCAKASFEYLNTPVFGNVWRKLREKEEESSDEIGIDLLLAQF